MSQKGREEPLASRATCRSGPWPGAPRRDGLSRPSPVFSSAAPPSSFGRSPNLVEAGARRGAESRLSALKRSPKPAHPAPERQERGPDLARDLDRQESL